MMLRPAVRPPLRAPMRGPLTLDKGGGSLARMLFGNGEDGFLFYPPSDLTRLFTTSGGPTNVAANDDPVGLWLDNHGWGGAGPSIADAQAEKVGTNPTFATNTTGWTNASANSSVTWDSDGGVGAALVNVTGSGGGIADQQAFAFTSGRTYQVSVRLRYGTFTGALAFLASAATQFTFTGTSSYATYTGYFVPAATDVAVSIARNGATTGTFYVDSISIKEVPGNHALNATGTQRPLYKTNAPYPYLNYDGTDDRLVSPYIPNSAGGMAIAFRDNGVSGSRYALAGGTTTGNKRCRIGKSSSGDIEFVFNDQFNATSGTNYTGVDVVAAQTWGGGVRRCYLNGELFLEESRAANMDGAGSGFCLGALEGGGSSYLSGRTYAALATSDMLTPAEVARITSDFQRTFQ